MSFLVIRWNRDVIVRKTTLLSWSCSQTTISSQVIFFTVCEGEQGTFPFFIFTGSIPNEKKKTKNGAEIQIKNEPCDM